MNPEPTPFDQLLALLSYEDLLRLARRAQIRKNLSLPDILLAEVDRRNAIRQTALPPSPEPIG